MANSLLRTDKEIEEIYRRQSKTVYRVCFAYLKSAADAEDALQDTFLQLIRKGPAFESEEHEKAWLIRTASNICLNVLRHWWRKREDIDELYELAGPENKESGDVLRAVMALPDRYRIVIYLYYYEGYSTVEIAKMLNRPESTVRNHLHEARARLKEALGEDFDEE